jgi:hypothetical protein
MSQARSDYAPVNGLRMYYEVHGQGRPLGATHMSLLRRTDLMLPLIGGFLADPT